MVKDSENQDSNIHAGEYVLGTLQGVELAEFEQRLLNDMQLQAEVDAWESRLGSLMETVEPVRPPVSVWRKLEQRTSPNKTASPISGLWRNLQFWRTLGMVAATVVLGLALTLFTTRQVDLSMDSMMVVLNDQSTAGWIVAAQRNQGYLNVKAVEPSILPTGKVCQLWMEDEDGNLFPLGVLPHSGNKELVMPVKHATNQRFMVSIEEENRLPTKKPSQEIVFEGHLTEI
ncbi:MAG: anti-sigma factor [Candidatus Thiodiazotropha sp. (ex Gloverina cf. vestifex)]|nr:anti-sigma factor [Candidatus Thiodiazotropha sp. (ex Gloverina cf. vestifex)]